MGMLCSRGVDRFEAMMCVYNRVQKPEKLWADGAGLYDVNVAN